MLKLLKPWYLRIRPSRTIQVIYHLMGNLIQNGTIHVELIVLYQIIKNKAPKNKSTSALCKSGFPSKVTSESDCSERKCSGIPRGGHIAKFYWSLSSCVEPELPLASRDIRNSKSKGSHLSELRMALKARCRGRVEAGAQALSKFSILPTSGNAMEPRK